MEFPSILPLLSLQSLQTLELYEVIVMRPNEDDPPIWEVEGSHRYAHNLDPTAHAISTLALKESYIETSELCSLITSMRGLKRFDYEHVQHDLSFPEDEDVVLDYQLLATTLAQHADTLAYLSLDDENRMYGHGVMQVVERLHALEELKVHLEILSTLASSSHSESDMDVFLSRFSSTELHTLHFGPGSLEPEFTSYCFGITIKDDNNNDLELRKGEREMATRFLRCLARRGVRRICTVSRHPSSTFLYEKYPEDFTKNMIESAGIEYVVRELTAEELAQGQTMSLL